jgi:hypothetical protein
MVRGGILREFVRRTRRQGSNVRPGGRDGMCDRAVWNVPRLCFAATHLNWIANRDRLRGRWLGSSVAWRFCGSRRPHLAGWQFPSVALQNTGANEVVWVRGCWCESERGSRARRPGGKARSRGAGLGRSEAVRLGESCYDVMRRNDCSGKLTAEVLMRIGQ